MRTLLPILLAASLGACRGAPDPESTGNFLGGGQPQPAPTPAVDPLADRVDVAKAPPATDQLLKFAAWGDSRPVNDPAQFENDYNTRLKTIVEKIFKQSFAYGSQFMVGSGDYLNAYMPDPGQPGIYDTVDKWEAGCVTQYNWMLGWADVYRKAMPARPVYFALGNHEALGWSDLATITYDETPNIREYMKLMIPGLKPWFSFTINLKKVTDAKQTMTAKFIFIAPNAWNPQQEDWLSKIIKTPTDYTFVIRHEANDQHGCDAPGMARQNDLIARRYTLLIQGHEHEYRRAKGSNELVAGNGGAPKNTANDPFWGYITVEQDPDRKDDRLLVKSWEVDIAKPWETFKVAPNGAISEQSRFP